MKSLRPFALAALAAVSGCRIEKPATVVPVAPSVDSFTVSSATAAPGAQVTLSWKTTNATEIELREVTQGELAVPVNTFEGTLQATVDTNALFVLVARGPGGSDARAVSVRVDDVGASDVTFQALPPGIVGGTSTTLVWTAPGARTVTLTAGAQSVDLMGQRSSGAVTVRPVADTTYTLTADGTAKTVTVVVAPALLTAEASPTAVEVGDTVTLSWTSAGAEKIVITSPGRGQLIEVTDPARVLEGTFDDVAPNLPGNAVIAYEIAAVKGTTTDARDLEVNVGTGLSIIRFDAPPVAAATLPYSVRWQTLAADTVVVKVDGVTVHQSTTATRVANGQFSFTSPAQDFAVELVASNARGDSTNRIFQVDAVGIPTSATLTASPTTVTAGAAVVLTWASPEARRVRIVDTAGRTVFSVTGQRAEAGMVTVNPNSDTTYTLTADNQLGNPPVTATAPVTVTGTPLSLAQFPPTALSRQAVDVTASSSGALYHGFAHEQVLASSQADFIDIATTGQRVLEQGANVTSVDLPFSVWLFGTKQSGLLTISRAGWMAWGAPLTVLTSNPTSLPSSAASTPPFVIAPFWDDLQMTADSTVFAQLLGNAPDESLVVQWDRVRMGSNAATELTFQVRVHQDGMVSFHYRSMDYASATPFFAAGVQDGTKLVAVRAGVTPASNTALYFFSPVTAVAVRAVKTGQLGGVVEVNGAKTLVTRPMVAIDVPSDLAISELMFRPASSLSSGQYVEFVNRTASPLDMTGWALTSGTTRFSVADGFTFAPGVLVLGASTDPLLNDDAGVTVAWGSLSLSPDAGVLAFANADAGLSLTYTGPADAGQGASVEYDSNPALLFRSGSVQMECEARKTFGSQTPLQRGTPGALADCHGYRAQSIPSRYVDISATGTRVFNAYADDTTSAVTLAATSGDPAPFAFGVRRPVISVCSNGWLAFGTQTSTSDGKTLPSSSTPLGTVAVFWDDLESNTGNSDVYWKRFALNEDPATPAVHWVVMWHRFGHYTFSTTAIDDLNFEVMLFEDGTIEYHYGVMTSGNSSNYANGNSATLWLEEPTGFAALPLSVNQPVVAPNTAWRFIPQ